MKAPSAASAKVPCEGPLTSAAVMLGAPFTVSLASTPGAPTDSGTRYAVSNWSAALVGGTGAFTVSATAVTPIPAFTIESLRPNPGDREVRVAFTLPRPGHVRLAVYDAAGRLVAKLHDGVLPAGRHDVHWSGEIGRIAAGVYLVRLEALGEARVRRLALVH